MGILYCCHTKSRAPIRMKDIHGEICAKYMTGVPMSQTTTQFILAKVSNGYG